MKIFTKTLFFVLLSIAVFGQENATGLIFDDYNYDNVPMKAPLVRGLYTSMPAKASLKQYAPTVGNQNPYGTCVGWSVSYAARTILWAKENQVTNLQQITNHTFSPAYIYRNIVQPSDYPNCDRGASIDYALRTMKEKGVVLLTDYPTKCPSDVPYALNPKANTFTIDDYARIFGSSDAKSDKIETTKKALSEGNPIVIGMIVPEVGQPSSFNYVHSDLWTPSAAERANPQGGGHAMCVIGYDDHKHGGAFEIMNSWGTGWGNQGFFWIKYDDYALLTKYAFELVQNIQPPKPTPVVVNPPTPTPTPKPTPKPTPSNDFDFAGELRIVLDNGQNMPIGIQEVRGLFVPDEDNPKPKNDPNNFKPDPNLTIGKFIAYRATRAYTEGDRFRIYLNNSQPAYVYVIAMDGTNTAVQLFPHKPNISPILNYVNSEIALPSETNFIQLDNIRGTDVMCLLYSKTPLDIAEINRKLGRETGTFFQRLYKVMEPQLVKREYLRYYNARMRFEVKSYGSGTVVPIVLEIPHQ